MYDSSNFVQIDYVFLLKHTKSSAEEARNLSIETPEAIIGIQ